MDHKFIEVTLIPDNESFPIKKILVNIAQINYITKQDDGCYLSLNNNNSFYIQETFEEITAKLSRHII